MLINHIGGFVFLPKAPLLLLFQIITCMKRILAALFCIAFFQTGFSQTGIVKGTVSDATSKETLIGAYVFNLNDKTNGTSTDIDGNFSFKTAVGSFQVVVTYTGMVSDTFKINVSEDQPTVLDIKLKPLVEELGEVVVSAGKFTQRIEEITQSIEIIKPSLVENKNTRTISTALEQTPGLTVYDSEPQIRGGSGFTFGVGTRVGIYVDDLPMLLGDAGKPEWGFIPVENLEQVEVVKGASSVLFGSGALSGVINIRTAYPKEKPETKINFYSGFYSSPETETMSGGQKFANFFGMDMQAANGKKWWNGPANFSGINFFHSQRVKQWDLVFGGSFQYDHNYIGPWDTSGKYNLTPTDTLRNSDVSDKKGRLNFKIRRRSKKKDGLAYGLNGNFMRTHTNFSLIWNNDSTGLYRSYPDAMTLQEIFTFYLDPFITYVRPTGTKHYLRSRFYYADNQNSNNQSNRSLVSYGEYQLQKNFLFIEDLNMTAGLMAQHTKSISNLYIGDGNGTNHSTNAAVYTQLDKKFWKAFNISLGLRYEFFQINNLEVVTKPVVRSGLSIKLAKATYLRSSYGQGYRFPTIAERYIVTSAGGLSVFPNPNLQPETSWNGEIGIKQGMKIGKFYGYLDIVGFWQEYNNAMEYVMGNWGNLNNLVPGKSDVFGFKFLNTGDTRIRGLEMSIAGKGDFTKNFSMTILAGYTLLDPRMLNPTTVFAYDSLQLIGTDTNVVVTPLSYQSTSSNKSGILKYRSRHQFKGDVEFTYKKLAIGYSARYYSFIENIDQAFFNLDKDKELLGYVIPNSADLPSGITKYRAAHTKGTWVMDARISYQISKKSKIAFIVSNLANIQYSLRPLKMEAPRSASIQYTLSL
jgi:iron complex outermembrane receptor protein